MPSDPAILWAGQKATTLTMPSGLIHPPADGRAVVTAVENDNRQLRRRAGGRICGATF